MMPNEPTTAENPVASDRLTDSQSPAGRLDRRLDEATRNAEESAPSDFVAMLLCEPYKSSSYYVCELVRGVTSYLESVNVSLSIISSPPSRWPAGFGRSCSGVLVIPTKLDVNDIALIEKMGCPFVTIAESSLPGPTIGLEIDSAATQLTELLLDCGHRHFAMVSGHEHHTDAIKRRAILRTLAAAGISREDVPDLQTNYDPIQAERAATDLLKCVPRPTAVIGFNDDLAVHALTTAQHAGIAVPAQMSVAGFNDGPSAALLYPRLTTIRLPIAEAGQAAATSVWQAHRTGQVPVSKALPSTLIIRDSVAVAP